MAARSTLTVTSGTTITSAWGNSVRDHVPTYTGSNDVATEGQLAVNTSTDQLVVYTGSAAREIASYGAWQNTWTPTLNQGGALSTTTVYARYARYGRTIVAAFRVSCPSGGAAGSNILVTLPVASQGTTGVVGSGYFFDLSASTYYPFTAILQSTTTFSMLPGGVSSTGFLGLSGYVGGMGISDVVEATVIYEAAS